MLAENAEGTRPRDRWLAAARRSWPRAAVALAAFTVMSGTLSHPPVWDDVGIVRHVEKVYRDGGVAGVVLAEWRLDAAAPETGGFYRPVAFLSLWADNRMALSFPWNHHVSNVALHVLNSLAVLALLTSLLAGGPALLGALLFAVHPVHVESVALAANRTDLLACLFVLASTLAWRSAIARGNERSPNWRWFGASLAAFLLGGLSKETALVLPVVLVAWGLLQPRGTSAPAVRRLRGSLPWLLGWGVVVAAILVVRHGLGVGLGPGAASGNLSTAVTGPSAVVGLSGTYARLLIWPWPLKAWYGMNAITADGATVLSLAAIAALSAAPWAGARDRIGIAGLLWTAAFLLPVSGIVPLLTATAAERFLYLPSVGYCVIVAAFARFAAGRVPRWKTAGLASFVLAILVLGSVSIRRTAVWASDESLAKEMIRVAPDDPIGYANLGRLELDRGNHADAVALTREAVRREPRNAGLHVNLGLAFEGLGSGAEAIDAYRRAIELSRDANVAARRLPGLLADAGRNDEAVAAYGHAIRLNPSDATIYNDLGALLGRLHRVDEASRAFSAAVALEPGYAEAHYNLGAAALSAGAFDGATTHLREAVRLRPGYVDALNDLGIAYAELGRIEEARRSFSQALEIDPGHTQVRGNLERLRAISGTPSSRNPSPRQRRN